MYPNTAFSAWQLTIMAIVPVVLLFGWLIAIFVASREPGGQNLAAAGSSPVGSATADPGSRTPATVGGRTRSGRPSTRRPRRSGGRMSLPPSGLRPVTPASGPPAG